MNINELLEDSDTSDEDYLPTKKTDDVVSEVDSDGDSEDPLSEAEDLGKRGQKRKKKRSRSTKKLKYNSQTPTTENSPNELTAEEKKRNDDALWADFMQDTGFKSKNDTSSKNSVLNPITAKKVELESQQSKRPEKVKITQIFEFAGEEVKIEKEVPKNSVEARLLCNPSNSNGKGNAKHVGLSGIGSVLSQLGKKQKISTLEKSKLDWDSFKREQNIEEELQTHNKGKDGYLERQDFLQRADVRRFEIEKEVRTIERNKRMNNVDTPF